MERQPRRRTFGCVHGQSAAVLYQAPSLCSREPRVPMKQHAPSGCLLGTWSSTMLILSDRPENNWSRNLCKD